MSTLDTVGIYVAAWNEPDEEKRRHLLEQAWADEGTYTDPQSHVAGRDALIPLISEFQRRFQGTRIELSSSVDEHHGLLRFAWRIVGPSGPVKDGMDFGELAEDGRLRRIVGFFGPLPGGSSRQG
jgi:SnoaL-like protein